jgi:hypothetical protein
MLALATQRRDLAAALELVTDERPRDDRKLRIERARQRELRPRQRLRQLLRSSEERYQRAAQLLAAYDSQLEATRAVLRRNGYLGQDGTNR